MKEIWINSKDWHLDWEVWESITDYEWLYEVSSFWRVRRIPGYVTYRQPRSGKYQKWRVNGRTLKIMLDHNWYCIVKLSKNHKQKTIFVHKLVMLAFKPNWRKRTINHIDGNPINNHVDNLEWATYAENIRHSFEKLWRKSWTYGYKWKMSKSSKKVYQYTLSLHLVKEFYGACEAERKTWFSQYWIRNCCTGRSKSAYWFFWSYKKLDGDNLP